ncbi:MAG TPA: hydrogenase 3 maturation endopeptidase HyCI [Methanospirillum sp.]|uniref:hydrogenase 3 maturation endopeptidase HyCI n=1 Tax=Methanospirillum sp. TaxID=45200 RepID=UPI002C83F0BC|nr:hydrogenase 3 maturation endopeptidase HyCI [Methanospirillum sp.]HWQ64526.1 hydrogenase 3 maturation endopeptidase HyCI [Methanospirillum sp.]
MIPPSGFQSTLASLIGNIDPDQIVFVGVGNRMLGDDGIGPVLLDLLSVNVSHTVDVGVTPEEYTGVIRRLNPSVIVFLDAADFGAEPGQMKIIMAEEVSKVRISIHKISLEILMEYLKSETGADVFIIGIQPAEISHSSTLSPPASQGVQECAEVITSLLNKEK